MVIAAVRLLFLFLLAAPLLAQTKLDLRGRYYKVEGTDCATGGWKTHVTEENRSSYDQTFPPFELRCGDIRINLSEIKFNNLPQDLSGQVKLDPSGPIDSFILSSPAQFNASVKGSVTVPAGTSSDAAGVQIQLYSALDDTSSCRDKEDNYKSSVDFEESLAPCVVRVLPYMSQSGFTAATIPVNLSINAGQGKQFVSVFVLFEMFYQPQTAANSISISEEQPKRIQKPDFLSLAPLTFQARLEFFFTADEADIALRALDQSGKQLATSKLYHLRKADSPLNWVQMETSELQIPDDASKLVLKGVLITSDGTFESPPIEYPVANVKIDHIEAVQTVQTASNGVTLVTQQPVFVRVFLAQRDPKGDPIQITGEMTATDEDGNPVGPAFLKGPLNGPITVPAVVNRAEKDHSLIFAVMPSTDKNGVWEIKVKLKSNTGKSIEIEKNVTQSKKATQSLAFRHITSPPLDLVIVPWRYWPPGLNLPRFGGQPALDLLEKILPGNFAVYYPSVPEKYRTLNLSLTKGLAQKRLIQDLRLLERRFQKGDIPDRGPGLSTNSQWIAVVPDLYRFALDNGTTEEVEVLGMSNPLWDGGQGRVAWVQNLSTLGPDKASKIVAHEVAHNLGLYHAGGTDLCAGAGPIGWTYRNSSIQEPGWDRSRMSVVPSSSFDVMSNCNSRNWVSPLTAQRLIDSQLMPNRELRTVAPLSVVRKRIGATVPTDYLLITGSVKRDGSAATLDPIFTFTSNRAGDESNPDGEHCLVVRGSGDPQRFCFSLTFQIDSWGATATQLDEEPFAFKIPTVPGLAQVTLERNGARIASLTAGANPPSVRIVSPTAGDVWDGGERTVSWISSHPDGSALTFMVDYSFDDGRTWLPVTPATTEMQATFGAGEIQGGDSVRFRVFASDGLRTAQAEAGPIRVIQRPAVEIGATTLDFHQSLVGMGREAALRFRSKGAGPVSIRSLTVDRPEFVVRRPVTPFQLPSGMEAEIGIEFVPGATGDFSGTLTIATDDPNNPTLSVTLRGVGVSAPAPEIGVGNSAIDFGSVSVGQTVSRPLTISNFGTGTLLVSAINIDNAQFKADLDTLRLEMEDAPLTLSFTPVASGPQRATLTIVSNASTRPQVKVSLTGTGVGASVPKIAVSPSSLDFGSVALQQSKTMSVNISNRGDAPLTISALSGLPGTFSVSPGAPLTVAAGGQQMLTVRFAPTATGTQTGRLTIQSNDPSNPSITVAVTGSVAVAAAVPQIDVSPSSLDFGTVALQQSKTLAVTVSNRGNAALMVTALSGLSGAFSIASAAAPLSVAPGASVQVSIRFAPVSAGAQSAALRIASNDPDPVRANVIVQMTGTGGAAATAPAIAVSPASLDFGSVGIGQSSTLTLTVTNRGSAPLVVNSIAADSSQFVPSANGFAIAPGMNFPVQIRFTPATAGAQAATLTLISNDPSTPILRVALKGSGTGGVSGEVTLKVDGGTFNAAMGYLDGSDVAVFVNRLTPPSYPATLKNVQIYFGDRPNGLRPGSDFYVVIATNPTGSAAFTVSSAGALYLMPSKVASVGGFNTFPTSAVTITSGDFVVGLLVNNPPNFLPVELDQSSPSQKRSYGSSDGVYFTMIDDWGSKTAGNFGIRAAVTVGAPASSGSLNLTARSNPL